MKNARMAGGKWRLGASKLTAKGTFFPGHMYGEAIAVHSEDYGPNEFDELVVGKWIHLEQMDSGSWWMNVGGVTVWIRADRDGNPKRVTVYGPGDYADPCRRLRIQMHLDRRMTRSRTNNLHNPELAPAALAEDTIPPLLHIDPNCFKGGHAWTKPHRDCRWPGVCQCFCHRGVAA
jgi:hypothetical protein